MKVWTTLALLMTSLFAGAWATAATPSSPLYELSRRYETSVANFEKLVLKVRGIDRADEKLVDRLDDAATQLRLAAKNPRHQNRLFYRWQNVLKYHVQVEQKIFGKYTPNHELILSWDIVQYHQRLFAEEFFYKVENPQHDKAVRRIPSSNKLRDQYFRSLGAATSSPTSNSGSAVPPTPAPPMPTPPASNSIPQ